MASAAFTKRSDSTTDLEFVTEDVPVPMDRVEDEDQEWLDIAVLTISVVYTT